MISIPARARVSCGCPSISTVVIESKERFPNRREEASLFVVDRIIQADRDSAQRSPHLTRLWLGKTVRASVGHSANEGS